MNSTRAALSGKLEGISRDVALLKAELETVKEASQTALEEAKNESNRAVLFAGLVPEGVSGGKALEQLAAAFVKSGKPI